MSEEICFGFGGGLQTFVFISRNPPFPRRETSGAGGGAGIRVGIPCFRWQQLANAQVCLGTPLMDALAFYFT